MREFLDKFGIPVFVAILVIAAVAVALNLRSRSSLSGNPSLRYYIDEDTHEESVHSPKELPPLMGKNGKPTVVEEITYTCDGGKTRQTLCFLKYSDDALAKLNSLPPGDTQRPDVMDQGKMVRAPEANSPWVSAQDSEGSKLLILPDCPTGKAAVYVYPQK